MKYKKIIIILIITIFTIGMIIGTATAATHTVQKGKYTVKLTEKEYKQLNTYETKYKTVTKTRNVTKYKEVEKTRPAETITTETINKTSYIYQDKFTVLKNDTGKYESKNITMNSTEKDIKSMAEVNYSFVSSSNATYYPEPKQTTPKYIGDYRFFTTIGEIQLFFERNTTHMYLEHYNETVPYTETEKYTEKVPYLERKDVTITNLIPGKYVYVKKANPIVKTVKVPKTIGKYQYIGKCYLFGIQTNKLFKNTQKRIKTLRKAGWKINKNKHKVILGEDGLFYHYFYCTKKVYVKQKKIVGYKTVKVKKPLSMTIRTWTQNAAPKGKVYVTVSWNGYYIQATGYASIK